MNNGVYKAGFARSQEAYDEAFAALFAALDELEAAAGPATRYLLGDAITEADWRLFPTLVRFDAVYYSHFKCNQRRLIDYPHLWRYTRDLYGQPGIAATVAMEQIKRHYYTTHDFLNPSRIIPDGPALDFGAPTRRRPAGDVVAPVGGGTGRDPGGERRLDALLPSVVLVALEFAPQTSFLGVSRVQESARLVVCKEKAQCSSGIPGRSSSTSSSRAC